MKTYSANELEEIIEKHGRWLRHEDGGERANLIGASLIGAYLRGATGNRSEIKSMQCDPWPVTYTATHMQIGCQVHEIRDWWKFSDDEIDRMDSRAMDWWAVWKPILKKIIKVSPAVMYGVSGDDAA